MRGRGSRPAAGLVVIALALLLFASAGYAREDERISFLILNLQPATGVDASQTTVLDGIITNAVARHPELQVVSADELAQMLELEGERQTAGCDTTSCLGEIAAAMGARYAISGKAGKLGDLVIVSLNLFDSTAAKVIARQEVRAGALDDAASQLAPAVEKMLASIEGVTPIQDEPVEATTSGGLSGPLLVTGGVVAAAGLLGAVTGVALIAWATAELGDPEKARADKDAAAAAWPFAVGAAVAGAGLTLAGGGIAAASLAVE